MSIRSEIRAALVDGPKTVDELLPLVPSAEDDRARLASNVSVLATAQSIRRTGLSDDGKPIYQLDPKAWPAKDAVADQPVTAAAGRVHGPHLREAATPPPKATKPAAKPKAAKAPKKPAPAAPAKPQRTRADKPAKSQRTAAKVQRKTATSRATPGRAVTVASEPDWRVGLQLDGSVFAFDPSAGTHQVIAAPIVRQILGMAALLRPAA